jgi:3-oxoacyl-[acyl-carrier-protein] synthase III
MKELCISGLVTRLGSEVLSASDLSHLYSAGEDDPTAATGITQLFRFSADEDLIGVTAESVLRSLQLAGLKLGDVGGIIATSNFTHPTLVPTFAVSVADRLGLRNVRASTVGTGCGGLGQAVECASGIMLNPMSRWPSGKVCVVIAADQYSHHIDPSDYKTRYLFSDSVAVFVLAQRVPTAGDFVLTHASSRALIVDQPLNALQLGNPGIVSDPYFRMKTGPVVRFTRLVLGAAKDMIGASRLKGVSIIPHQANTRLLAALAQRIPEAHLFYMDGVAQVGNTLNASTLFGLQDAQTRGLLSDDILLVPFGAEWMVGAIRLQRR